jgi:hypothetical protein
MGIDAITVGDVAGFWLAKVHERDVIENAAAKGKPLTEAYIDASGRAASVAGGRSTRPRSTSASGRSRRSLKTAVDYCHVARNVAKGVQTPAVGQAHPDRARLARAHRRAPGRGRRA